MNYKHLDRVLFQLHIDSVEIESSAIISSDGITVASNLNKNVNEDHMGAMSAALLSLGDRMIDNLSGNTTDRVMIQSDIGYVIITSIAPGLLLTVVARSDAKLGMVFHDIKNAAKTTRLLLEQRVA